MTISSPSARFLRPGRFSTACTRSRCGPDVARMSEAICGDSFEVDPGCRFAHPGYTCCTAAWWRRASIARPEGAGDQRGRERVLRREDTRGVAEDAGRAEQD